MTVTIEERLETLEVRVGNLETWAGPGQGEASADGLRAVRSDLAQVRQTQNRHTRMLADLTADVSELKSDVATLKTDVATLKTDMTEVKTTLAEVLRRLPEPRP
jgi:septal ring factor EnvC (AmiA/AmiB activator)